ncbi:MAG: cysteine hydrolase [Chloroflexi bacterium]|nr:cysteine hydrolase [Chloroflexota bacterium]
MADIVIDPKTTVLMVQKQQKDWLKYRGHNVGKVLEKTGAIAKTASIIAAARSVGMPIIWVAHLKRPDAADQFVAQADIMDHVKFLEEGTEGVEFIDGIQPGAGDHVVYARRYSAFYNTDLEIRLRRLGVKTMMFTGLLTNASIMFTIGDAWDRDFNSIVVSDCCVTYTEEMNDYYMKHIFPLSSKVRTAAEILAALPQIGA